MLKINSSTVEKYIANSLVQREQKKKNKTHIETKPKKPKKCSFFSFYSKVIQKAWNSRFFLISFWMKQTDMHIAQNSYITSIFLFYTIKERQRKLSVCVFVRCECWCCCYCCCCKNEILVCQMSTRRLIHRLKYNLSHLYEISCIVLWPHNLTVWWCWLWWQLCWCCRQRFDIQFGFWMVCFALNSCTRKQTHLNANTRHYS